MNYFAKEDVNTQEKKNSFWLTKKEGIVRYNKINLYVHRDAMAAWTSARTGSSTRMASVTSHQTTPQSSGSATRRYIS